MRNKYVFFHMYYHFIHKNWLILLQAIQMVIQEFYPKEFSDSELGEDCEENEDDADNDDNDDYDDIVKEFGSMYFILFFISLSNFW